MQSTYHTRPREELLKEFAVTEESGLSEQDARERLNQWGLNTIQRTEHLFGLRSFLKQFINPLVLILVAAFFATLYLAEYLDAFVIALALLINVAIGFVQEFRASRAFALLMASQEHQALVLRDGVKTLIQVRHLVPGDIVFIEAGNIVPADLYLLGASDLSVSEAHLTGESSPVEKHTGVLGADTPVYERKNTLFMGSTVLSGTGVALVVSTGNRAEIGAIAEGLSGYQSGTTPVEKSIERLARFIALVVMGVVVLLLVFGFARGMPLGEILLLSIALAVSAVPEGLPAAVTAILAVGMEKILKERGLVRNLLAAETLGSTTIILTDKTGTLTEAKMRIVAIATKDGEETDAAALSSATKRVLLHALYASDATVISGVEQVYGRPVERAIASFALDAGLFEEVAKDISTRSDFLKFSSERRFAVAVYPGEKGNVLYATGAPEILLKRASRYLGESGVQPLTREARALFKARFNSFAREGKRLIGVASKSISEAVVSRAHDGAMLEGSVFEGFLILSDPVRADVPDAIAEVRSAGVRVVMVTGDTPETALAIAREAGIAKDGEEAVVGSTLDGFDDASLAELLMTRSVFARVLPEQKKRLVSVLEAEGEVVGMTGDGVNDAPALKAAAIGIAVGSGTAVAREVADLVLLGDSFSILAAAIREGRRIMDNLKKTVTHLVATSFHEVFLVLAAVVIGLPLPILPLQILWVNILEGGLLTFAFAFEPAESDVMKRSPHTQGLRTVLTKEVKRLIMIAGTVTGVFSVALFLWLLSKSIPIEEIRTIMFVVLAFDALFFALSLKRLQSPVWTAPLFNNHFLLVSLALSVVGLAVTFMVPGFSSLLGLVSLSVFDILVLFGVAFINLLTIEISKRIAFRPDATIGFTWKQS